MGFGAPGNRTPLSSNKVIFFNNYFFQKTMKFTMKKFQLVRKYANYPTSDEKQNAP